MRAFEILKTLCLCILQIYSKETNKNATKKQSLLENIIVLCRVCLQIADNIILFVSPKAAR